VTSEKSSEIAKTLSLMGDSFMQLIKVPSEFFISAPSTLIVLSNLSIVLPNSFMFLSNSESFRASSLSAFNA